MSRILTLVRHAKSSWKDAELSDFERPLNDRGLRDAPRMGKLLADSGYKIERIISSPARRAMSTAKLLARELEFDLDKIVYKDDIYDASLNTLIEQVSRLNNDFNYIMLVGHNPGFTYLCNYLCDAHIDNMPTCSIAQIQFDISDWGSIPKRSGHLLRFDYPKKLND